MSCLLNNGRNYLSRKIGNISNRLYLNRRLRAVLELDLGKKALKLTLLHLQAVVRGCLSICVSSTINAWAFPETTFLNERVDRCIEFSCYTQ